MVFKEVLRVLLFPLVDRVICDYYLPLIDGFVYAYSNGRPRERDDTFTRLLSNDANFVQRSSRLSIYCLHITARTVRPVREPSIVCSVYVRSHQQAGR